MDFKPESIFLTIVVLVCLCGCSDKDSPSYEERRSGRWGSSQGGVVLSCPDTVAIGERFEVEVLTNLNGCDKEGPTYQQYPSANEAILSPFDLFYVGENPCPGVNFSGLHQVEIMFDQAGEGRVSVEFQIWGTTHPDSIETHEVVVQVVPE